MKKLYILVGIIIVVVIFAVVFRRKSTPTPIVESPAATSTPATTTPVTAVKTPSTPSLEDQAWAVFQKYLIAAKNHDLTTLTSLSYQISSVCKDPSQQSACFQRMDAVYTAAKDFQEKDFTHIAYDQKQIILSTDWAQLTNSDETIVGREVIYFTRTPAGTPQFLSLDPANYEYISHQDASGNALTQMQIDASIASTTAAIDNTTKKDSDSNGWWDSIQQFFYASTTQ